MTQSLSIDQIRQELPSVTSRLYLNTGTFGPLAKCTVAAIQARLSDELESGRLGASAFESIMKTYDEARLRVSHLLHADPSEIALTDNTGEGMNIISYGFAWQPGDEVITTNHEHIGALAPLYQLTERYGIVVKVADLGTHADHSASHAISDLISDRTRLVVISHVTWTTGALVDIQAVSRLAHARNIPVLVDGAQSAGAIPIDVKALEADFYAIPMQKWLCCADGTGALYINKASMPSVSPTYVGYFSTKHEPGIHWELLEGAQRFELGGRQTAAIAGQIASLTWFEETLGYEWMYQRISELHSYAFHQLSTLPDIHMFTPAPGKSGLISFTLANYDSAQIVQQLSQQYNIYVRNIPDTNTLRVSTGFYNTHEEINTLVSALHDLR